MADGQIEQTTFGPIVVKGFGPLDVWFEGKWAHLGFGNGHGAENLVSLAEEREAHAERDLADARRLRAMAEVMARREAEAAERKATEAAARRKARRDSRPSWMTVPSKETRWTSKS